MTALPFTCPACGEPFGFGEPPTLLAVVTALPFTAEPTPCCGVRITGTVRRDPLGDALTLEITEVAR